MKKIILISFILITTLVFSCNSEIDNIKKTSFTYNNYLEFSYKDYSNNLYNSGNTNISKTEISIIKSSNKRNYNPKVLFSIGGKKWYKIKKGDTIYSIGRKFNVSPQEIIQINNLNNHNSIKPGKVIKIPNGSFKVYFPVYKYSKGYKTENIVVLSKCSELVYCPINDGIITHIAKIRGYGNSIIIGHAEYVLIISGFKDIAVQVGDRVSVEDLIGTLSNDGHIYISLFRNKKIVKFH